VSSTIEQILTGIVISDDSGVVRCTSCGDVIAATDIVFAYASRCVGEVEWRVPRLHCVGCAPAVVHTPTLGVTEAIVGGRLGTRSRPTARTHRSCLAEIAVRSYSPPTEG
jgi:hypothetical protein